MKTKLRFYDRNDMNIIERISEYLDIDKKQIISYIIVDTDKEKCIIPSTMERMSRTYYTVDVEYNEK